MSHDDIVTHCKTEAGDCIEGRRIYVQCTSGPTSLTMRKLADPKSKLHKYGATITENAYASIIEPHKMPSKR